MNLDNLLTVSQVAKMCPSPRGGHVGNQTVRRWMNEGINGVVLKSFTFGRARVTTREDLDRFIIELNRSSGG